MSSRHLQYMCHRSPGEKSGLEVNLGPVTMTEHLRMPAFNRQGQEEWRQDWRRQREWEFVAMVWATLPQEGTETTKEVHTQLKERKCNPRDDVIQVDSGVYSWDCITVEGSNFESYYLYHLVTTGARGRTLVVNPNFINKNF